MKFNSTALYSTGIIRFVLLLALSVMLFLTTPTNAQSLVSEAGPFYRPILSTQVERYARIANLDADQKASVKALYRGYKDAFKQAEKKGAEDIEKQLTKSREGSGGSHDRGDTMQIIWNFVEQTKTLERTFFEDFQAILKPEQSDAMKAVKLARSRDYGLRFAAMAGDGVDLTKMCDELKVPRTGEVAEALDEYETQIQRHLETKEQIFQTYFQRMMKEGDTDTTQITELFKKFIEQSVRLRDTNRQSSRLIVSLLPEDKQRIWEREFKARSYPTVSRPLAADKALRAIKQSKDLTDSQRKDLLIIEEGHQRSLDAVNQRWITAIDQWQNKLVSEGLDVMGSLMSAGDDDPLTKARKEREELDKKTLSQLEQFLTQEQQKLLGEEDDTKSAKISDELDDIVPFATQEEELEESWANDAEMED